LEECGLVKNGGSVIEYTLEPDEPKARLREGLGHNDLAKGNPLLRRIFDARTSNN
jgi:hypothetical protein